MSWSLRTRLPLNFGRELLTPENQPESEPKRGRKLYLALACYTVLALLAAFTLDGNFRLVVWLFLGYLAIRTYLHTLQKP